MVGVVFAFACGGFIKIIKNYIDLKNKNLGKLVENKNTSYKK